MTTDFSSETENQKTMKDIFKVMKWELGVETTNPRILLLLKIKSFSNK